MPLENESPIGLDGKNRRSSDLLPAFYRSDANKKFLSSTLDQFISQGQVKKISGYVGRQYASSVNSKDIFIKAADKIRQDYQLEPAAVIEDRFGNVDFFKDYIDHINHVNLLNGITSNHNRLNEQEFYSWRPHIDWDKFVNFQQYYWLPNGPDSLDVAGQQLAIESTFTVQLEDQGDVYAYIFSPDGLTRNPTINLYRGQTYRFDINSPQNPFSIKQIRRLNPPVLKATQIFEFYKNQENKVFQIGFLTSDDDLSQLLFKGYRNGVLVDPVAYSIQDDSALRQIILEQPLSEGDKFLLICWKKDISIQDLYLDGVDNFNIENGQIIFNVPLNAPDLLYYMSEADPNVGGSIVIKSIEENTFLDVEKDIIGKKNYKLANGVSLTNGMKLNFIGNTNPAIYQQDFWYVEGVGDRIKLINEKDLEIIGIFTEQNDLLFDNDPFDSVPFSTRTSFPKNKDYIVINRSTIDKNAWSRTNRWFHQDVIKKTSAVRNITFNLDQNARATRPIIEFNSNIKLYNFGHVSKANVDLIDNFTKDVFSTIEGSLGYNIDGIDISDGMRILFTADSDRLVKGRIFKANFINITNAGRRIDFTADSPSDSTGSVNIQTDRIKCNLDHGLVNGDRVIYLSNGNIQLQGLIHRNVYFVKVIDEKIIELYTDSLLQNKIDILSTGDSTHSLEVFSGLRRQINLVETEDSLPLKYETLLVNYGNLEDVKINQNQKNFTIKGNQGLMYWFNGDNWILGPVKSTVNQTPYFDVFDKDEYSFGDSSFYEGSNFSGTKLFSYKLGDGSVDKELNFPLTYRNINNIGDIVFEFNLINDFFNYKSINTIVKQKIDVGYIKKILDRENCAFENGWITSSINNPQSIVRVYKNHNINGVDKGFPIDCFDDNLKLDDLKTKVYINGKRLFSNEFYVVNAAVRKEVLTIKPVASTDIVTLKLTSKQPKNEIGHYEMPINLQNNPLNNNLDFFSLGEVIDHVDSIVDNLENFIGQYPGNGNLRDLGNISTYGVRFVQHSGPLNLSLYSLGSKDFNVMKSLKKSREEYIKFKTSFLVIASELGIITEPKQLVDIILNELNKDKPKTSPYFLSDMFAYTANKRFEYKVLDDRTKIYPLSNSFNLDTLSNKSVLIYRNNDQLTHGKDYIFYNDYFKLLIDIVENDLIEVYEYENTDGCFCPPTPSKLGIYPAFEPVKYVDDTFVNPCIVVRGHDGSITVGFNDYRDDVLLELEKRIYNNIKIKYDTNILDILSFTPGKNRETKYSKNEFDSVMSQFFYQWMTDIGGDLRDFNNWDYLNPFTYNYRNYSIVDDSDSPSFWRGIYYWLFDTDSPHKRPWESLNFSVKPSWWQDVYGPAPYTSDNYILWDDLRDGIIREPGKNIKVNILCKRPILNFGKPVDQQGKLLNPIQAGLVKGLINPTEGGYHNFGDQSPVETAWRRSSNYCFAVIQTLIILHPAKVIALCFDRSRIARNLSNQYIFKDTQLRIRMEDIIVSPVVSDNVRNYTSGLINYVVENISVELEEPIAKFKNQLSSLKNKISSRLGGFTTKEKLRIILDSKNPVGVGGIFVPAENYKIFLNTSSPVAEINYSGIFITKYSYGFELRGYDKLQPYFKYFNFDQQGRQLNIGGISDSFIVWNTNQRYIAGQIVKDKEVYYRVLANHVSGNNFDKNLYVKLPELPRSGGRDFYLRDSFDIRQENILPYGSVLSTIQEVVDVILGYAAYLTDQGFAFDQYSNQFGSVQNWITSVKEFVFWTTQNWSEGSAISLSPAANGLFFESKIPAIVDNIVDSFYDYSIFRVDGQSFQSDFTSVYREKGSFSLIPVNTDHGLFGANLRLIQKEHIILLDNKTLFNDIIYDVEPGYKQDKIRLQGYVTTGWNGSLNIPGFIFDNAKISEWNSWTDYNLGDIVFYRDFYYSSKKFAPGTEFFKEEDWIRLDNNPTSKLLPNWNYKADQFLDFYDLDSDNFDSEQQKLAQHLIGYQKRQYLENIIIDDISQYKFYQGMISEKGTQNVLSKLFDVLGADNKESLTFYEEWAIRVGNYGATETYDEIEFILDEEKIRLNPQPIEFTEETTTEVDFIYRVKTSDIAIKPVGYKKDIWPVKSSSDFLRTPGYVRYTDVRINVDTLSDIIGLSVGDFKVGDYVWAAFLPPPKLFSVYRLTEIQARLEKVDYKNEVLIVQTNIIPDLTIGDIIALDNLPDIDKFYQINDIIGRKLYIKIKIDKWNKDFDLTSSIGLIYKFTESRIDDIDNLNSILPYHIKTNELIWVDNDDKNKKAVYINSKIYSKDILSYTSIPQDNLLFGKIVAISNNGLYAAVLDAKKITIYSKNILSLTKQYEISSVNSNLDVDNIAFSQDGVWLIILGNLTSVDKRINFLKLDKGINEFDFIQSLPYASANFGTDINIVKEYDQYVMAVSSAVNNNVYIYNIVDNADDSTINEWILTQNIVEPSSNSSSFFGQSLKFDLTASTLVIGAPGDSAVYVYERVSDGYNNFQKIYSTDKAGTSVAISSDGKRIAVGCVGDDYNNVDNGRVDVYKLQLGKFVKYQSLRPIKLEPFGYFGHNISFMNNDETLVVFSLYGDIDNYSTFDFDTTTFDNNSLKFNSKNINSGRVDIFDRYKENYIFGESLSTTNTTDFSDSYGSFIAVGSNTILVSADKHDEDQGYQNIGQVFSYSKLPGKFSWNKKYQQADKIDIGKIKKVFLYDNDTNKLIKYLDVVDPVSGKIPGIADAEIKYKTYYDPAFYNIGNDLVNVDAGQAWNKLHIGVLWWDLTRAKFIENNLGNTTYNSANWNKLYSTASIDVYEWVETKYKPSEWDALSNTNKGFSLGISGTSRYGNSVYSVRQTFDNVSQTFKYVYYYWVKNPNIVPNINERKLSAQDVSKLIEDPVAQAYNCISFIGSNSLILVNLINFIKAKNTNLNIEYWTVESQYTKSNSHSQWKLLSLDEKTVIPRDIEIKWFDSLLGKDSNNRVIPNYKIPLKKRYGIQNRPRQGMFVNRFEALKQFIEYVNKILKTKIIVDDYDISKLFLKDEAPKITSRLFDQQIDSYEEIKFVNVGLVTPAILLPILKDGRLIEVQIVNPGFGYKYNPKIYVHGSGSGAEISAQIDSLGQINSVTIEKQGNGYKDISLRVRKFSVLVKNDSTINNLWAIYEYNNAWNRTNSQSFNTQLYWNYIDWYETSYNQFTKINVLVKNTFELHTLKTEIGQIIKVENVGSGGWLLLEKYANQITLDYTENFKVVGRQNGTIQFKSNLYDFSNEIIGFDSNLFDTQLYDNIPVEELKIILNVIKDKIFVDDLYKNYLELFFNSLRFVLYEQPFVDYIIKTSFVKSKHNLGELKQKITYKSDSLENFEDFIKEVKPYRTKIREYVSSYTRTENTLSSVTDFDLPSFIDNEFNIQNINLNIQQDNTSQDKLAEYPWKHWYDNVGFKVCKIDIVDGGSGYIFNPVVKIIGNSKKTAVAKAYISAGKVNRIQIINFGSGYLKCPEIVLDGGLKENGRKALAVAVIESEAVRTINTVLKFDRLSKNQTYSNISFTEQFIGTGSQLQFALRFAPRIQKNTFNLLLDGLEALKDDYAVSVKTVVADKKTRFYGILTLETAPVKNTKIEITYQIGFEHLNALDRITNYYNPTNSMLAKDFSQLITGIDYAGVDIQGLVNFVGTGGWDSLGWGKELWGEEDFNFDDQIFTIGDNSSYGGEGEFKFNYIPSTGQQINVYLKRLIQGSNNNYIEIRLDDPNFGTGYPVTNNNAVMQTIIGNGVLDNFELPNPSSYPPLELIQGDIIIFRKSSSDGSKSPKPQDYDTQLSGGNLIYSTATGINPDDINVDGDGLVTATTSYAPEEVIPGQIMDSLAVKVFQLPTSNGAKIFFKNYIADGLENKFNLTQLPQNNNAIIVKVGYEIKKNIVDYTFNYVTRNVELTFVPAAGLVVSVIGIGYSADRILDVNYFSSDGSTLEYITAAPYVDNIGAIVLVNGNLVDYEIFETDSMYYELNRIGIRFSSAPASESVITYLFTDDNNYSASVVKSHQIVPDGSTLEYNLQEVIGIKEPKANSVLVMKNGQILNPGLSEYFTLKNNNYTYTLSKYEQGPGTIDFSKIEVYIKGVKQRSGLDYTIDATGVSIVLNVLVYIENAVMVVVNTNDSDYLINENTIKFTDNIPLGTYVEIVSFYNHDVLEIVRTEESLKSISSVTVDTPDYYRYKSLKGGKFKLFKEVAVDDFLWIIRNNTMLTHGIDYYLDSDLQQVVLSKGLEDNDILDVIIFGSNTTTEGYAYMSFKDIFNRTHYKRLNKDKTTRLSKKLGQFDIAIHVEDSSKLDVPNVNLNTPGIIEINGERIEYFEIDGNTLKRLRRSTLGTGANTEYKSGTLVVNLGKSETIPYLDEQIVKRIVTAVDTNELVLPFDALQNEIEVFVGGKRLKKTPYRLFNTTNGFPYSPEGDSILAKEFEIVENNKIKFAKVVDKGVEIMILKKQGKIWEDSGNNLHNSTSLQARFILEARPFYPEFVK